MQPPPTPPPPPPTPLSLPSVSLGQQPTRLRPGSQDAASKSHPNVSARGLLARAGGSFRPTAAVITGHRQGRQKTIRLLLSLEPSFSADSLQIRLLVGKWKAMEPHRRELLALWQQSLAQAMMEVEAMLRSRGRVVPRQMAASGGGARRLEGGAAAPGAHSQGAGPPPGPSLGTEEHAASPAAHSLTEGCHLAATVHKGCGCEKIQSQMGHRAGPERLLQTELLQKEQ